MFCSCTESCLVLSLHLSLALMCLDKCSGFRCGKTGLHIQDLRIFAVTTVCGSATVLTVAKSSRQMKVCCLRNTHWWVSPPNKMRCRPMPARQQQSQGCGRACGPGLVLLALPLQLNHNSKGPLQCNRSASSTRPGPHARPRPWLSCCLAGVGLHLVLLGGDTHRVCCVVRAPSFGKNFGPR